jgi:hypothetical protein
MHIKFIRAGRSGQKAAAYLTRERADEEVIVRRGNPVFFASLADSLGYKNPYSSAVIAFAPEDQPTDEQIEEVIEAFQRTAWAGLEDDDFCTFVVEHRRKDGKGTHLHFLVVNHHIGRKKHYNPAPPGWQKRYDLLRDYLNLRYGWARPDDPERTRKVQPGYLAFPGVAAEKRQVLAWAEALAEMGLNGEEIAEVARASGAKVPRMGTDYITLAWGEHRVRVRTKKKEKKEVAETIEEERRKWERALEKLAEENQKRYGPKEKKQGEKTHGRAEERNRTSSTGTSRNRLRRVPVWNRADAEPGSGPGGVVVLPLDARLGLGGRYEGRIPRRMRRLGTERIRRIEGSEHAVRIRWAGDESPGAACKRSREPDGRSQEPETPAGGVRVHNAARHGGGGAVPAAAGHLETGMAGLWAAMEDLFRRLGEALRRANTAARTLCAAAYRLVVVRGIRGMSAERQTGQAGQPPAARREAPRADVPKRDWPRQGWPPGRQGPGWG